MIRIEIHFERSFRALGLYNGFYKILQGWAIISNNICIPKSISIIKAPVIQS